MTTVYTFISECGASVARTRHFINASNHYLERTELLDANGWIGVVNALESETRKGKYVGFGSDSAEGEFKHIGELTINNLKNAGLKVVRIDDAEVILRGGGEVMFSCPKPVKEYWTDDMEPLDDPSE